MTITDRRYGVLAGVAMKAPCRLATTANITLSGLQSIDGTTTADQDRVLVKNQTDTTENGIYVASSDTWSRATDFDSGEEIANGTIVFVTDGSTNSLKLYFLDCDDDITIDTTALAFTSFQAVNPGSTTDNAIARYDGTSGALQNSVVTIADTTGMFGIPVNGGFNFASGDITVTYTANTLTFAGGTFVFPAATFSVAPTAAADDGAALGSASVRWSDLFLAEGGVINWDNGDVTITQSGNSLTIAGGNLVTAAGTTAEPGLQLTSGTAMTTPVAGAIEMDANCIYATTDAGNRGYIPVRHFIRANATRTLPDDTNENAIFNDPSNGTLTLETGTYLFEGILYVTGMDATSGNALIDILGAGTATAAAWLWSARGIDATDPTAAAAQTGSFAITQASVASIVTAGTGTALAITLKGTFEITGAGTIIPSIDQVTAEPAVVNIGSYIAFERIGSTSVVSVGQWT